jgi:hypothetical protein
MDTVILDVYLITRHRPLSAVIPVAGNHSTRPMSSCVADMLDRKEINAHKGCVCQFQKRNYRSELITPLRVHPEAVE